MYLPLATPLPPTHPRRIKALRKGRASRTRRRPPASVTGQAETGNESYMSTASGLACRRVTGQAETGNESYRFHHSSRQAKARIKAREQTRAKANEEAIDATS